MTTPDDHSADTSVAGMVHEVLATSPPVMDMITTAIGPVHSQRDAIRALFIDEGAIRPIETAAALYKIGAVDGASATNALSIGDHHSTLGVAVRGGRGEPIHVVGHRAWTAFQPHSADSDTLVKAIMMIDEMALLPTLGNQTLAIIDGSHITAPTAIAAALASTDSAVVAAATEHLEQSGAIEALETTTESPSVMACPKSDSSPHLWRYCADRLALTGASLPDKVVATLVLRPGELLTHSSSRPDWGRFHTARGRVSGALQKSIVDRMDRILTPRYDNGTRVYHLKAHHASTALRVEVHADVDDGFEAPDFLAAIAADCDPPHTQEPLVQYLADVFAKSVSISAAAQLESARLDLSASVDTGYLEHVLRRYRS